jgi:peptide deformylase
LTNPHVAWASEETASDWEGCLSFLRFRVRVSRPVSIRVGYVQMDGSTAELEASGFYARVLQHEIDHLDGILTIDRAQSAEDIEDTAAP